MKTHSHPGRFIVLEGIDGAGTTTHAKRLYKSLRHRELDVEKTFEPTGGPIGGLIRQVLQHRLLVSDNTGLRPFAWSTMALLFAGDRLDHLDSVVVPALREGKIVVSDRYVLSSLIYQSVTSPGGESVLPWIRTLNERALRPDLTLVLDVSVETAEKRRKQRSGADEMFDNRQIQERLAELYLRAEELVPGDRIVHVPAEGGIESVSERLIQAVDQEFKGWHGKNKGPSVPA